MSNSNCSRSSEAVVDDSNLDYISKLPDEVLVYILDKLYLEEAMVTSFLSKRWRGLWRYKKKIELDSRLIEKTGNDFLPSALKIFRELRGQSLQSISLAFRYNRSMKNNMQSLIAYASEKKVEDLYIDFDERRAYGIRQYPSISIPECELRHSSVVKLTLKSLQLETFPPRSFEALRELFLERAKLQDDSVLNITGNCPSLAFLSLSNCNPNTDLRVIVAENSSLVHLLIREMLYEVSSRTTLCIKARVLKSIEFAIALPRKEYQMETSLCYEAAFRLDDMCNGRIPINVTRGGNPGHVINIFWGLFNKLRAANVLTLSSWCIQVLAVEVAKMQAPLNFEVQRLTLETGLSMWEFRGIAYLLLGCSKLEQLVIVMGTTEKLDFTGLRCKPFNGSPISYGKILQNLAIVEFINYKGGFEIGEDGTFIEDCFFNAYDCGSLLVWNLKFFASNLQKVRFITAEKCFETCECGNLGEKGNPDTVDRPSYCRFFDLYESMQQQQQRIKKVRYC